MISGTVHSGADQDDRQAAALRPGDTHSVAGRENEVRYAAPRSRRKILFVTSEITDYVQAGGLGEVSATLPRALASACDVRVLLPGYKQVVSRHDHIEVVARLAGAGDIPACDLGRVTAADGMTFYIVLCPHLYERDGSPYVDQYGLDWLDNDIRFARLSLAAAQIAEGAGEPGWRPGNLHLNDWPSALTSGYLAWRGCRVPSLLTIHNLGYQGVFDAGRLGALDIPGNAFHMHGVEFYGKLSFLKAGLYYASHLTTVSETYAREITTPELGCGMHGLLAERSRQGRLTGILNGIDESWDPRRAGDALFQRFDPVRWKARHADYLRGAFGLSLARGPLFAIVSRLVHQKGVDLAIESAETIVSQGGQLIVTGQGEPALEEGMRALQERYKGSVGVRIGFDPNEARSMFAGSDFLLMPSRFEPCGLSQMYAQKSGSLPIAHRTGGLADTIEDGRTGFLFRQPTVQNLNEAIKRALDTFTSGKRIGQMRRAAMSMKFGWDRSANQYARVYDSVEAA